LGVDVDWAMQRLYDIAVSIHCWQGDDVGGFERNVRHKKACIRRQFSIKLPRERNSLTVQGDFDKIVDTNRSKLCLLGV